MVSVAIFSFALFVSRSETIGLAHRKCWWGPGPGLAMQACVDPVLPLDRSFTCVSSVPGPGNVVLGKRTCRCPWGTRRSCRADTRQTTPTTITFEYDGNHCKGTAQRSRKGAGGGPDLVCGEVREGLAMSVLELRSESRKVTAWRLGAKAQSRISRHQPRFGAGLGSR